MNHTPRERVGPIGLEFDEREIRAAQYARRGSRDRLRAAMVLAREDCEPGAAPTGTELARLRDILDRRGFTGDDVAVAVPGAGCAFHILDLPPEDSGAPIGELALIEARRAGAHKSDDIQLGTWSLPESRVNTRFACSVETDRVNELAGAVEHAGLVVTRVTPPGLALFRAAEDHDALAPGAIHALLGIGWSSTRIVIALGSTPVYMRTPERGLAHAPGHASRQHLMDELASQIDSALAYVSQIHRRAPFGAVLCSGYLADDAAMLETISTRVAMPAASIGLASRTDPAGAIERPERRAMARLDTACGLALGDAA